MGIPRLFSCLSSVMRPRNLRDLSGSCVGIDGNIWLHRAMYGSSLHPTQNGPLGERQLRYFVRKCRWLLQMGIAPIVVFDGAELPAKTQTRISRQFSSAINQARGVALAEYGKDIIYDSPSASSSETSHGLIHDLCAGLSLLGVEARVAPYETDAQLTHMYGSGIIDALITEDSDLLVFGCPKIICKIDAKTGIGLEFSDPLTSPSLRGLSLGGLQLAAVLAGCDYGPHISGLGIRKAIDISLSCEKYMRDDDLLRENLESKLGALGYGFANPIQFFETLQTSLRVFRHQTIFDEGDAFLKPLKANGIERIPEGTRQYLGPIYSHDIARKVYEGLIHPVTHQVVATSLNVDQIVDSELFQAGTSGFQTSQTSSNMVSYR